jgi:predicted Zn-dependent protease
MFTPHELVERALAASATRDCVVFCEESSTANLRWAANTLTTNGVTEQRTVTVIAIADVAGGVASGTVRRSHPDAAELTDMVAHAEALARASGPAEDAHPLLGGHEASPDWAAETARTSAAVFDDFARDLGETFVAARSDDVELFGYAEHELATLWLGSSSGLRLRHTQPTGRVENTGKSHQRSRSSWIGQPTATFRDVDMSALYGDLLRRLGWADRTLSLPPGRYSTLLPPSAVADLATYLYWSASARQALDGRSVFSRAGGGTRVGERLTSVPLTISSDPGATDIACPPFVVAASSGPSSSVFDNGLPLRPTTWIDDGVLTALTQTTHTAADSGLSLTPAVDNLTLSSRQPSGDLDAMVAGMEQGLLLTTLWYIREVDPQQLLLTGLTRDGVYRVENGEVVGAVNNFRFNESPVGLLSRVSAVGVTAPTLPRELADYFTRIAVPPLRVDEFNMSSVSPAS